MIGRKKGFTIIELLAVMAIIAVLLGVGIAGYNLVGREARESRAIADIEKIRFALEEYRVEYGQYPLSELPVSVKDLVDGLTMEQARLFVGTATGADFLDPWGATYRYACNERFAYRIWSENMEPHAASGHTSSSGEEN